MAEDSDSGIVGIGIVGEMIVGGAATRSVLDDYISLITSEHNDKPNFISVLSSILQPFVDEQNLLRNIPSLYDLDLAVGSQLDVVGQWVGLSRRLQLPIAGVYFSLDIEGLGLDQGVLQQPFDPVSGLTSLDDNTYRLMLYAKIAANIWDGSLAQAEQILSEIFASSPGTLVFIQDNFDMSMYIGLAGVIPSALFAALLAQEYIPLRPAAVKSTAYVTSVDGAPIFGLDVENSFISGLDVGALAAQVS